MLRHFNPKRLLLVFGAVFLIMLFCGGDYGLIRMYQLSGDLDRMETEIDRFRIKNIDLLAEKELLLNDNIFRKTIATEKYGMVSEGVLLCRLVK